MSRAATEGNVSDFSAIERAPSLASRVVEEMLEAITSGRLRPGFALPTERALSEQFGVSRTVVREAIRALQAKGVVQSPPGRGAVVAEVSSEQVAETVDFYVRMARSQSIITPADISEVRRVLELALAELAAQRATEDDLGRLGTELQVMRNAHSTEEAADHDEAFHRCIALASRNALFVTLLDAMNVPIRPVRIRGLGAEGRLPEAVAEHEAVYDAIARRDAAGARAAMEDHLEDSKLFYFSLPGVAETAESDG